MKFGKTIKIFLIDGDPNGRMSCEISNWSGKAYKIPRITDMCTVDIELIASNEPPTGAGETAIVAGAGAIANAVTRALLQAGLPMPQRMPITAANLSA